LKFGVITLFLATVLTRVDLLQRDVFL